MDLNRFRTQARNWEAFGRRDPLFGVLSDPTKQHGRWDVEQFFDSGRAHVAKLFRILAAHDVAVTPGRAFDFGCGVGRLTLPIAERFEHTVGVDVARSMIRIARRHNTLGARCEFVVNTDPDLHRVGDDMFDFVHSCLVLQHIPPEVSVQYIREFLRIARPGGIVVFQVPARTFTEAEIDARLALPPEGYRAAIQLLDAPGTLTAGEAASVRVRVTNLSPVTWSGDILGGRHICIANHWLDSTGAAAVPDDGRHRLTEDVGPGESIELQLRVTAPGEPGKYFLDVDLVQERICWFAQRGSGTARSPVEVREGMRDAREALAVPPPPSRRRGLLARLRGALQRPAPTFEMHVVPRADVEAAVVSSRGTVLHAIEDSASGAGWLSYTYVCRKLP